MPSRRYHQPFCRILNLIRFIFFSDLVVSSALWLAGGDSQYLEDNVTKFKLHQSVFDLALIRFLLAISFIASYTELESLTIQTATRDENNEKNKKKKQIYSLLTFLFTTASLAYSIVKCIFIIQEHKNHPDNIHTTYYALAISSVAFSGVEFLIFFINIAMLRKMAIKYTRMEEDLDNFSGEEGKKKKTKADLRRLFGLAKPVSYYFMNNFCPNISDLFAPAFLINTFVLDLFYQLINKLDFFIAGDNAPCFWNTWPDCLKWIKYGGTFVFWKSC